MERLAAHLLDTTGSTHGSSRQAIPDGLLAYLDQVLASRIAPTEDLNEGHMADVIRRKLLKEDPTGTRALRFVELHQRLIELGLLRNRGAMLYLLYAVSEQKNRPRFTEKPFGLPALNQSKAPMDGGTPQLLSAVEQTVTARKPVSAPTVRTIIGFDDYKRDFKARNEPQEQDLLRDLLYVFQGIDGRLIKYQRALDGFVLDDRTTVSSPLKSLLLGLTEIGWHFRHVANLVARQRTLPDAGLVSQSLCLAVDEELLEYHRLLVVLESQLDIDPSVASEQLRGLTLKRLLVWAQQPLDRLKTLGVVLEGCLGLKGGALISSVYGYTRHGDSTVSGLVHRFLRKICAPYFDFVRKWVVEGQLVDTYSEFFVVEQRTDKDAWTTWYQMRPEQVPLFFSSSLARQIFAIGKSLNFMRDVCGDKTWSLLDTLLEKDLPLPEDDRAWLNYEDMAQLTRVVGNINTSVSARLLEILTTKHSLMLHLQAMRRYMLMGQGEFIQTLMTLLWDDLNKPASKLLPHKLTNVLLSAIRSSNAQFDDLEIQSRLGVRLHEVSTGDTGWDVFTLDYHVDPPLSSVFTRPVMLSYYRLFTFLWKLRRVEYALNMSWRMLMEMGLFPEAKTELHTMFLLRSEMAHMMSELQYYVLFEVLECSWVDLLSDLKNAKDFDSVLASHYSYLRALTAKALLDEASKPLRSRLNAILLSVLQFYHLVAHTSTLLEAETQRRQLLREQITARTKNKGRDLTKKDADFNLPVEMVEKDLPDVRSRLTAISIEYRSQLRVFLVEINSASTTTLPLQSLRARLDFNEYYSLTMKTT